MSRRRSVTSHLSHSRREDSPQKPDSEFLKKIKEMRMDSWYPLHSPPWIISGMVLVAALCIPLGVLVLIANDRVKEVEVEYGTDCSYDRRLQGAPANPTPEEVPDHCPATVRFNVEETLKAPVFLYYKLTHYNQNFRYLVRSRSDSQLQGSGSACECEDGEACPPYESPGQNTDADGDLTVTFADRPSLRLRDIVLAPCGQMAHVMFNDSFLLYRNDAASRTLVCNTSDFDPQGEPLGGSVGNNNCQKKGIAWSGDKKTKYVAPATASNLLTRGGMPALSVVNGTGGEEPYGADFLSRGFYWKEWGHFLPDQTDYDFMMWSKPASVPSFKKLLRKITIDLTPGVYELDIQERYDVSAFGDKKVLLATRSWVGADNTVLGVSYIIIGSIAFAFAVVIALVHTLNPVGGYTADAAALGDIDPDTDKHS